MNKDKPKLDELIARMQKVDALLSELMDMEKKYLQSTNSPPEKEKPKLAIVKD